jgi:chromosome segregation ATPase
MKRLACLVILLLVGASNAGAQNPPGAEQLAESLRSQLRDVIAKESELQTRLQQIDEDLKPENIQRSIALIGSLRPEELREQRRQQLEKDRASVSAQLDAIAGSRTRLESSIARAEAEADRERTAVETTAAPTTDTRTATTTAPTVVRNTTSTSTTVRRPRATRRRARTRPPRRQPARRRTRPS